MVVSIKGEGLLIRERPNLGNLFGRFQNKVWKASNQDIPLLGELRKVGEI